jgi:MoxR-like ATPase
MSIGSERTAWFRDSFEAMTRNMERAVLGKRHVIRLTLTCLVSEGHMLLED